MAQTWTLKRWSFNGHFWQRLPTRQFDNYDQAIEATKLETKLGIQWELSTPWELPTPPDVQASEPAGDDHE